MYIHKTSVGIFWVELQKDRSGLWWLGINGEYLGSFPSAVSAACAVASHKTGWGPWDEMTDAEERVSPDLGGWEKTVTLSKSWI